MAPKNLLFITAAALAVAAVSARNVPSEYELKYPGAVRKYALSSGFDPSAKLRKSYNDYYENEEKGVRGDYDYDEEVKDGYYGDEDDLEAKDDEWEDKSKYRFLKGGNYDDETYEEKDYDEDDIEEKDYDEDDTEEKDYDEDDYEEKDYGDDDTEEKNYDDEDDTEGKDYDEDDTEEKDDDEEVVAPEEKYGTHKSHQVTLPEGRAILKSDETTAPEQKILSPPAKDASQPEVKAQEPAPEVKVAASAVQAEAAPENAASSTAMTPATIGMIVGVSVAGVALVAGVIGVVVSRSSKKKKHPLIPSNDRERGESL
eukprot:comp6571_c0_seq1/m.2348 comp6571_c0_seq1/g.2348  ORF comp6571_c0_seq1/g.2348 comp6571_c0_seq1/m.2348 type:complete len:314 (-) comp6571_c0_seq1:130-1071(-)